MEQKQSSPPANPLQQIKGIGPIVAQRLAGAGIDSVSALAAATPEQVEAALAGMAVISRERVLKWITAAAALAPPPPPEPKAANGQRYATYKLELLLGQANEVRRTRVSHVQSGQKASWAGWELARLSDFVRESAGTLPPAVEAATVEEVAAAPPPPPAGASAALLLRDLMVAATGSPEPRHMIHRGRPYDVRFGVAVGGLEGADEAPAQATTALYVRPLGGGDRYHLGRSVATRSLAAELDVQMGVIPGDDLKPGPYRLEVEFDLQEGSRRWPTAHLNERTVLVY